MAEKPILFNGEAVRALLARSKTQTRRPLKPQPIHREYGGWSWDMGAGSRMLISEPPNEVCLARGMYKVGELLWVREAWAHTFDYDGNFLLDGRKALYRADEETMIGPSHGWRPSIHMPKWAARIWLEVTGVRVEQVQDISARDVVSEGYWNLVAAGLGVTEHFEQFSRQWDAIYGDKPGLSYDENPWVVALTFKAVDHD